MHAYVIIFAFMIVAKQERKGKVNTETKSESKIKNKIKINLRNKECIRKTKSELKWRNQEHKETN